MNDGYSVEKAVIAILEDLGEPMTPDNLLEELAQRTPERVNLETMASTGLIRFRKDGTVALIWWV